MSLSGPARVRALLLSNAALSALVGSEIYTPWFHGEIVSPGLAFWITGGAAHNTTALREQSITFAFYGDTPEDAQAVYEAARTAMLGNFTDQQAHYAVLRGYDLALITEDQEGQNLNDAEEPDKGTPFVLGIFTIRFI